MNQSKIYYNLGRPPKWAYFLLFIIILILLLSSCKTIEYVPKIETKIEYRDRIEKDTIILKDSVYIHQIGDTVYSEKYKYIYKEHLKVDTAYILQCDTITTIQEVEKKLSKWDTLKISVGGYCMTSLILLILALLAYMCIKIFKK